MTTQELEAPTTYTPPTTYSEIIRDEVKAEAGRRGISQRRLSSAMGISQQSISDRWRGRIPWTLDEVERLEPVLGLTRGALLLMCARRDSNPQPSDLSPLQVLLAAIGFPVFRTSASAGCFECLELGCGGEIACDCGCHDYDVELERRREDLADLPGIAASAETIPGCANCPGCPGCSCYCHDDEDAATTTTAAAAWELAA